VESRCVRATIHHELREQVDGVQRYESPRAVFGTDVQAGCQDKTFYLHPVRRCGQHNRGFLCAESAADKAADSLEQDVLVFVELDEMLRVTDYRPGRWCHARHALATALPGFTAEHELLEVTAQNPTGAVSESQNREIAAGDPAPERHAAHAEQSSRLRDAVKLRPTVTLLPNDRRALWDTSGLHAYQIITIHTTG
jgi:hypothetical protein